MRFLPSFTPAAPPAAQRRDADALECLGKYSQSELLDDLSGGRRLSSFRPDLSYRRFSRDVRGAGFWRVPSRVAAIQRATFCETVANERISHAVLVPTMMNLLTAIRRHQAV